MRSPRVLVVGLAVASSLTAAFAPDDRSASPPPTPSPARDQAPSSDLARIGVDELGRIPIVEWHDVDDTDDRWDVSITTFRRQLETLYRRGYRPVPLADFAAGRFDVPAGTTPVVLTFDDSFRSHLWFTADGRPHPDSVVGTLEAFAATHDGWRATASFYLFFPRPFREAGMVDRKIRWLHDNGYELGNHSYAHDDLSKLDDDEVQRSLARAQAEIARAIPGFRFRSIALPFGAWPRDRNLAVQGTWNGESYRHDVVLLVGDMPYHPPYHVAHRSTEVMRVQSFELDRWLDWLDRDGRRFVSDGDPDIVTVPRAALGSLRPAPRPIRVY